METQKNNKGKTLSKDSTADNKKQNIKLVAKELSLFIEDAKLIKLKLYNSFLYECFQNFFNEKLNKKFEYISTLKKLEDTTGLIKEFLLKDAIFEYFESDDGKFLIKQFNGVRNEKYLNPDYCPIIAQIYFDNWVEKYLKPISVMLILFSKDKNMMYEELKNFGVKKKQKNRGRASIYSKYFESMKLVQEYLEKKYGRRIRGKSDDTTAVKHVLKHVGIPFKHSAVTAYNNWKNKLSHKSRTRKIH